MSLNMQERREQEKIRVIQESKQTAGAISIRLFILFGLYVLNFILSITSNKTGSLEKFMSSDWIGFIAGIAIGVVIITIPDYDGACKRAGAMYLIGILINIILFSSNPEVSAGFAYLVLITEAVLIILYYMMFTHEMGDRVSSLNSGMSTFWKVIGKVFMIGYIVLICLIFYIMTSASSMTYSSAKTYYDILKLDAYAILAAQIALTIMCLVTAITLKTYADEPIGQYPSTPGMGYPQPYHPNTMPLQPGQPYPPMGTQQVPPMNMPPQGQPYQPMGTQQVPPMNMPPQGQPYQPMAVQQLAPAMNRATNYRIPASNQWRCACGLINPNYTGTCACGRTKSEVRNSNNQAVKQAANRLAVNRPNAAPAPDAAPVTNADVKPANVVSREEENIRLLKEYKDLLDSGIITQEEFDEKKRKLLS